MRWTLTIALLSVLTVATAQNGRLPLEYLLTTQAQIEMKGHEASLHPEVKPYSYWTLQRTLDPTDTTDLYVRLPVKRAASSYISVAPRLGISAYNQAGSEFKRGMESIGGVGVGVGIRNRFYLQLDGVIGYMNPPTYYDEIVDSLGAVPGMGYIQNRSRFEQGYDYRQLTAVASFRASEHFEFFLGRGKNAIGEGYRSMFLSDFAPNYNFFRTDLTVWRLKYMVLYSQMRQSYDYPQRMFPLSDKYATTHYLSLNLTSWWSVGAFESVVWESEDSVVNRNFDFNYLNPVIFYRPVEYGMGSSDNSLLGFSSTIRPAKGLTLYGQILLDEFLFGEWSAPMRIAMTGDTTIPTGYWANKQAYQIGVKWLEPLGWNNASVLAEVNVVRPFTYGHSNRRQGYTHFNQSLAHPLGSNFIEWVQVTTWQPGKWRLSLVNTLSRKGYSTPLAFMGEDLMVSNRARDEINREHGNFIGQGRRVDVANMRLNVGYTLIEQWNLRAEVLVHYRMTRTSLSSSDMVYVGLGVKTALWNDARSL